MAVSEATIIKRINKFLHRMAGSTVRIVKINEEGAIIGLASGFLYKPHKDHPLMVITAGHGTPEKGCFVETKSTRAKKTLLLNAGEFKVFYSQGEIDYACSYFPPELIRNDTGKKVKGIPMLTYKHTFVKADEAEAYGFAVCNDYGEFVKLDEVHFEIRRYPCFEIGMTLVGQDEHFNYFQTARPIRDDEFYSGASGSPVADPSGAITGIFVGRTGQHLRVFRLDNIDIPPQESPGTNSKDFHPADPRDIPDQDHHSTDKDA